MADTAARLTLVVRRYEVARFTIVVRGIDLRDVDLAMQVRLRRGTPGAPLINLGTVGTTAAEGLKLDSVTIIDGVPVSIIKGRINRTTMDDAAKVPFAGELGDDMVLAYAMRWVIDGDSRNRIEGDFIVRDSAFESDGAPANRPIGYGSQAATGGDTGTLIFGDQVIQVSIDGADVTAVNAQRSEDAAERASADASSLASASASIARNSALVGDTDTVTRGARSVVSGVNSDGVGWVLPAPDAGTLKSVLLYVGTTGTFQVVVLDTAGTVIASMEIGATNPNLTRVFLPSQVELLPGYRVCLVEKTGRIHYQMGGGADTVLVSPSVPAMGSKPAVTTLGATASWNYDISVTPSRTLAQTSLLSTSDADALKALLRPLDIRVNAKGRIVATYADGTESVFGRLDSARAPIASNTYAADDPPAGAGSMPSFNRWPGNRGIVVPAAKDSAIPAYRKAHAANPAIITFNGLVFMYFRADPGTDVQSTGLWTQPLDGFDPLDASRWTDRGVVVGIPSGAAYDGTWDPAAVVFKGKVRLYWNNHNGQRRIFTAESADGITFGPAVETGVIGDVPGVFALDDTLFMTYGVGEPQGLGLVTSSDGITFALSAGHVITAAGTVPDAGGTPHGLPDGVAVDTARYFYQAPYLYMVYGGSPYGYPNDFIDWPESMCLARAQYPFTSWEKHPANPIMLRGSVGAFDAGGVWSGCYFRHGGVTYLFYEAIGGSDIGTRDIPYKGFGTTAFSQIGVATAPLDMALSNWGADIPSGVYTIRNVESGKYLGATSTAESAVAALYGSPQAWIVTRLPDGFHQLSLQAAGPAGARLLTYFPVSRDNDRGIFLSASPDASKIPFNVQEWKLTPQKRTAADRGIYEIINRYTGFNVGFFGNTTEGALAEFNTRTQSGNQRWEFARVSA